VTTLQTHSKIAEIRDNGSIPTTLINTIVAKLHDDNIDVQVASAQVLVDWTEDRMNFTSVLMSPN
jgi:hypothetical protein